MSISYFSMRGIRDSWAEREFLLLVDEACFDISEMCRKCRIPSNIEAGLEQPRSGIRREENAPAIGSYCGLKEHHFSSKLILQ